MKELKGDEFGELINRIERNILDTITNQELLKQIHIPLIQKILVNDDFVTIELNGQKRTTLGVKFVRIKGISKFLSEEKIIAEKNLIRDIILGLYGQKNSFIFLIVGKKTEVCIYFGIKIISNDIRTMSQILDAGMQDFETSMRGTYPGILLEAAKKDEVEFFYELLNKNQHIGLLTGIPTAKVGTEEFGVEQIERLIRGLYGQSWSYLVISDPIPDHLILKHSTTLTSEIKRIYPLIKKTENRPRSSGAGTENIENLNRSAQTYFELLEVLLNQAKIGKIEGMWQTTSFFFSPHREVFDKMKILLKSIFSGEASYPEPVRTFSITDSNPQTTTLLKSFSHCLLNSQGQGGTDDLFTRLYSTIVTSKNLASLVSLPKEEMPGYDIKLNARYGVCIPQRNTTTSPGSKDYEIDIGTVLDRGADTGNPLKIANNLFTKHGLIIGITGSGKTNSCFHLLLQFWNHHKIPFLVIEPTKGEYRNLIQSIPEMLVFSLGDETIAPFRMNPFEVPDGVHVQKHLDSLRAVFNASFVMYAPMPYVLAHCLINVYEKNGWDLTLNTRGRTPTLEDLYKEIDVVVPRLGYHTEITSNVQAALKTRIRSLLLGGKGKMLNCEQSIPLDHILTRPTVLELKGIGDDEEKAFLMGILFNRVHEYREAKQSIDRLQHITLIEEAHRLFANLESGNNENAHTKQKAVETLCNILTEIRVYGEGMVVVDQVPTKLAPDTIKNTNIKIIHRTIAGDDRQVLAESTGLTELQKRYLINLPKGSAVVFYEDTDEPFMVQVPNVKDEFAGMSVQQSDEKIGMEMRKRYYEKYPLPERTKGPFPLCVCCDAKCDFRLLMEPLANDADLTDQIGDTIQEKRGVEMLEGFQDLLLPAIRSLGYSTENDPRIDQKLQCALTLCLHERLGGDLAVDSIRYKNLVIVLTAFKQYFGRAGS